MVVNEIGAEQISSTLTFLMPHQDSKLSSRSFLISELKTKRRFIERLTGIGFRTQKSSSRIKKYIVNFIGTLNKHLRRTG